VFVAVVVIVEVVFNDSDAFAVLVAFIKIDAAVDSAIVLFVIATAVSDVFNTPLMDTLPITSLTAVADKVALLLAAPTT
jgi:hypothetical protein